MRLWSGMLHSAGSHAAGSLTTHIAFGEQRAFNPWYCTPRWLPAVVNEAVFSGVSMAAEKTFSRINAGKSMLFLDLFIRCAFSVRLETRLWAGGIALRDGSLRSSMRLSIQASAWRLNRPLAELMPEKVCFFSAA